MPKSKVVSIHLDSHGFYVVIRDNGTAREYAPVYKIRKLVNDVLRELKENKTLAEKWTKTFEVNKNA